MAIGCVTSQRQRAQGRAVRAWSQGSAGSAILGFFRHLGHRGCNRVHAFAEVDPDLLAKSGQDRHRNSIALHAAHDLIGDAGLLAGRLCLELGDGDALRLGGFGLDPFDFQLLNAVGLLGAGNFQRSVFFDDDTLLFLLGNDGRALETSTVTPSNSG